MRKTLLTTLAAAVLSAVPSVHAEPVDYSHIPADTVGYVHVDIDRSQLMVVNMAQKMAGPAGVLNPESLKAIKTMFPNSFTAIVRENSEPLFLVHASHDVRAMLLQLADDPNAVTISYGGQAIKCVAAPENVADEGMEMLGVPKPATKPATTQHGDAANRMLGHARSERNLYIADLDDKGLIAAAFDLRTLIAELNVLSSKSDSLAKSDPHKLKLDAPGAILLSCIDATALEGLLTTDASDAADKTNESPLARMLSLDLTGSLNGKTRQVQAVVTDDGKDLNADLKFIMADTASSEQVQRLATGIKSLVQITYPENKKFIDPLTATSTDKACQLHWTWPLARFVDLAGDMIPQAHRLPPEPAK